MSQFYTTEQIDTIAGVIGNEINSTRASIPLAATSYTSFVAALDAAISSSLVGNTYVVIGDPTALRNFSYTLEISGVTYNSEGSDLLDFWTANRNEISGLAGELSIIQDQESGGMSFKNDSTEFNIVVKITSISGTNYDNDFVVGQGIKDKASFEFELAPTLLNMT